MCSGSGGDVEAEETWKRARRKGGNEGGRWTKGGRRHKGVIEQERDRKESGVTCRRNKCARVMLMANMVEEI